MEKNKEQPNEFYSMYHPKGRKDAERIKKIWL